jgi:hypothetical protein
MTRYVGGAPFPGQALGVLDQQRMLLTEVFLHEDGHAQERRLSAEGLQRVKAAALWIEARHLCPRGLMGGIARRGAAFVVRQHGQVPGALVGRLTYQGASRRGPVYAQLLLVRAPERGETMRGRRITVKRTEPTRDGAPDLPLLSNVPPRRASAVHLARLYGKWWSIETAFCESTTTLSCESNPLGYPKAALLTCCLALWAYNAVALLNAALRSAPGRQQGHAEVSG